MYDMQITLVQPHVSLIISAFCFGRMHNGLFWCYTFAFSLAEHLHAFRQHKFMLTFGERLYTIAIHGLYVVHLTQRYIEISLIAAVK